jgi:AcrR family transcriptional regulator
MTKNRGSHTQSTVSRRDRLIEAASRLLWENGVARTTIADIAAAADVPSGNVYYYFKIKDDIVDAVVSARVAASEATLAALAERYDNPTDRLKALFNSLTAQAEATSQHGCATGSLCTELSKRATAPDPNSAKLMRALIDGAEQQFQEMGRHDAHELAIEIITSYQGTAVLAHATAAPELLTHEADRVARWIDELQQRPTAAMYDVTSQEIHTRLPAGTVHAGTTAVRNTGDDAGRRPHAGEPADQRTSATASTSRPTR